MTLHSHIKSRLRRAGFTARQSRAVIATARVTESTPLCDKMWSTEAGWLPEGTPEQVWTHVKTTAYLWASTFIADTERAKLQLINA